MRKALNEMKKYLLTTAAFFCFEAEAQYFTLLKDIAPGPAGSSTTEFCYWNNKLYFRAGDAMGSELWSTDGTTANTLIVKDINPGAGSSGVGSLSVLNNRLSFFANDGVNGYELYGSDGTAAGTALVKDINPGSGGVTQSPGHFANLGSIKIFDLYEPVNGWEVWKTDGTSGGTQLTKDLQPGSGSCNPLYFVSSGGLTYFVGAVSGFGNELYRTDGSESGTMITKDMLPGTGSSVNGWVHPFDGNVLYAGTVAGFGSELCLSDGTEAGTVMLKDLNPDAGGSGPSKFATLNNEAFFIATDGTGYKLWKTDGTAAGTISIFNIGLTPFNSAVVASGNTLFYIAKNATNGTELWKTDGTAAGCTLVKDITPGTADSYMHSLTPIGGGKIIFTAYTAANGEEPWISDGTSAGTFMLQDVEPGINDSYPGRYTIAGDKLYAVITTIANGDELWVANNLVTLPLHFISFSAQKCNNNVCLQWETAHEQNVSHFEIERSEDGINFTRINNEPAKNKSVNNYSTIDNRLPAGKSSLYYRLKQVDTNGKSGFSTVETIKLSNSGQISIYPNPVKDVINIVNWKEVQLVQLTDVAGKTVKHWQNLSSPSLSANNIAPGVYFIRMKLIGGNTLTNKIIKL
ncbi:MAG: T9SS type A sorting domain-containing protein [Ferruginibacter sp.]